ncbi:hemagglutinin repeat-containing protein, partial [Xanthomonas albilineans]|uniref:two-partner secretion domain-containing protein n=1 Tax=Xanthomonas albilineans TaxID=29447 RepID=UPI000696446E
MNRIYRLVFNRALRVWQVASEQVRRPAGGGLGGADAGPTRVTRLCWALCYVLGGVCVSTAAHAQSLGRIVADPTAPGAQRPTVLNAGNGVPLVNITTPSAAGVSRNTYSQFDVGGQGAILNNSPVQSQTQLGGWVQGNPWLSTGAKVILNEVNGPVSHLGGYVEVAGARAEVVIANPAGIQVDGGGFLNASRVTLTTGTPIVTNGALDGYRVSGGTIQISGAGLDASRTDYTGLLARAVQVNAGIWAKQVQAVLGNNVVSADQRQITAQAASGAAPAFALDVGALGGMFANKIWLIGNEHGVGVRNAGNLGAQAGELVVTVDGRLENSGALQSQQDTQLAASGGIANAGVVSAGGTLQVNTAAEIDNSGGTLNAQRLQLAAAALRNQGGKIEQTGLQALGVNAGSLSNRAQGSLGTVAADAQGAASGSGNGAGSGSGTGAGNGQSSAGGSAGNGSTAGSTSGQSGGQTNSTLLAPGLLTIAGALDNDGGRIEGAGPIAVSVAAGLDNSAGRLGVAALNVRGDLINRAGTLAVYGDADLQLGALVNDQGHLDVANALGLSAASLSNQGGSLRHGGSDASAWHVQGLLDNTGGVLSSNAAAWQLDAQTVVNVNGHITHSGTQGLTLTAQDWSGAGGQIATPGALVWRAGTLDHRAATTSASVLDVQADSLDNRGGTLLSTGPQAASVQVRDLLDNGAGGSIASNGDLNLGAGTFGNAGGQVQQAGTGLLQIAAGSLTGSGGRLLSNGGLSLSGGAIDLSGGTTAAQWIGLHADSLSTAGGQLTSLGAQTLALQVQGALNNHGGRLLSNAGINLQAGALDNGGGTLTAAGSADSAIVVSGQLDNTQGTVASNGNHLSISADQLLNAHGTLSHAGAQGLTLSANGVDNTQGSIVSSAALTLTADTVEQRQGTLGAASVQVQAGTLDNSGGGRIVASGSDASVLHAQTLNNAGGTVASNGDLTLQATTLDNTQGAIQHAGTGQLQIAADTLHGRGGSIISNGTLGITGQSTDLGQATTSAQTIGISTGTLSTAGGHLTASGTQALTLHVDGTLDNTGGTLAGNGVLAVQAQRLLNAQGSVQAAGQGLSTLHITQDLQNQQGKLLLGGAGQLSAGSLVNQAGTLTAAGSTLQVQVDGTLDNHAHGVISSAGQLALTAGTLDNSGTGNVVAGGDLSAQLGGALDNDAGLLQANGAVQLQSAGLSNRGGSVVGRTLSVETQGQALDNSNGTLGSQSGALSVHSGALTNAGGRVQAKTDLSVQTDGQAIVNTGSGATGGLLAGGRLQVDGGSLDNRGGVVFAQGDARLGLSGVDNSAAGSLSAAGNLALNAASLNNAGGRVQGGQSLALALSGDVNNQAGLLASNGLLSLTAATLDNRNTFTAGNTLGVQAGQLQLQAQALNNQQGQLLSNGSSSVQMSTALDNSGGQIAAAGSLTTRADAVTNTGGMLRSQGNQFVAARALSGDGQVQSQGDLSLNLHDTLTNTGQLIANGNLSVHTDGDLRNQGVLRANNLDLSAANVDNAASGELSSQGVTHVQASGQLTNRGLIDGALTQLQAAILDNVGSGRVYGDHVAIAAGTLLNRAETVAGVTQAGTVAARQRLDIGVGQLSNTDGGLIYSDGDAAIGGALDGNSQATGNANRVDNLGSTIEIAGTLALHASAINNVRDVVVITKITSRYRESPHQGAYYGSKPYIAVEHVTQEDVLQPGAGPDAVIHAGGAMHLVTDNLHNTYARIAAGGDLSIDGITGAASVTNLSKTLYRYDDTEYTAYGSSGEDYKTWSDPTIITPIGYVGGSITSGGTLQINVGNLSNINQGPTAPNVQNATVLANLDVQGDQATIGGGGSGPLHGPYAVAANGVAQAGVTQHAIDGVNGQGSMAVNAAGGSPDRIVMGVPDTQLPSASLFSVQPNSGHALVETDPRFANYRTWLSSDAQLKQLGYNADTLQQRLGDGYYEQKLVREQIGQLTGRRFLEGYSSDEAQYQALLDAGATVGKAWGLRPGVALTAAQMAQLTSDIVWLVAQTVTLPDGRTTTALVPHVYLRLHPGDLDSGGALLAGANVDAHVSGTLTNTGTIAGRQLVSLDAGRIEHLGGSISGNQVALTSASDIDIHGASVSAVDALSVKAAGSINVTSTVDTLQGGDRHQYATTQIPRVAGLYVTGTNGSGILSVVGGGDVTLQGAQVRNAGTDGVTQLVAGHDLTLGAQTLTRSTDATRNAGNYQRSSETTHAVSSVQGAGDVVLAAGHDVTLQAAQIGADKTLALQAGHDIDSQAVTDTHTQSSSRMNGRSTRVASTSDEHVQGTQLSAGSDMVLAAGHDVTLQAAQIGAGKTLAVQAGHDIDSQAVVDSRTQSNSSVSKRHSLVTSTHDEHVQGTQLGAGGDIVMRAGNDLTLASTAVASQNGAIALAAGHDVALTATQEQHDSVVDEQTRKKKFLSSKTTTTHDESHDSIAVTSSLSGDTVQIAAGNDLLSQGAQIVGTGDVVLAAGNNLTLETAQNTHSEEHDSQRKKSGLFGNGGLSVTYGKQSLKTDATSSTLTHTGSTVGSLDGNVTMVAGNTLAITGSDVMALQGDITAKAKAIAITEVHDTSDSAQKTAFKQGGLTVSVTSAALNLAQGALHSA